jgi:CubicO group peptidase (beta-lactamase class C family)
MAAVGGRVLLSYGDVAKVSYLASARKSVVSMLYGRYVASGVIRLDATLQDVGIDDAGGVSATERQARVADLLITSSGVYHAASNPGDTLLDAPPRGSQIPGAYFLYSNWDFNALGSIFEARSGRNIFDALASDLVQRISMQDFDRNGRETARVRDTWRITYGCRRATCYAWGS